MRNGLTLTTWVLWVPTALWVPAALWVPSAKSVNINPLGTGLTLTPWVLGLI